MPSLFEVPLCNSASLQTWLHVVEPKRSGSNLQGGFKMTIAESAAGPNREPDQYCRAHAIGSGSNSQVSTQLADPFSHAADSNSSPTCGFHRYAVLQGQALALVLHLDFNVTQ